MMMILFYVGKNCYCCSIDYVIEVIPKIPLKPLPHVPKYFLGLFNYAGESIAVVDFSSILSDKFSKNSMHTRMILLKNPLKDAKINILGLVADEIVEVRDMEVEKFLSTGLKNGPLTFLEGIYNSDLDSMQQVNIPQLFTVIEAHS